MQPLRSASSPQLVHDVDDVALADADLRDRLHASSFSRRKWRQVHLRTIQACPFAHKDNRFDVESFPYDVLPNLHRTRAQMASKASPALTSSSLESLSTDSSSSLPSMR